MFPFSWGSRLGAAIDELDGIVLPGGNIGYIWPEQGVIGEADLLVEKQAGAVGNDQQAAVKPGTGDGDRLSAVEHGCPDDIVG